MTEPRRDKDNNLFSPWSSQPSSEISSSFSSCRDPRRGGGDRGDSGGSGELNWCGGVGRLRKAFGEGTVGVMGVIERKLGSFWSMVIRSPMGVAGRECAIDVGRKRVVFVRRARALEPVKSDGTDGDGGALKMRSRFLREE